MFSRKYFAIYCNPPESKEELQKTPDVYTKLGSPGCIGSTDCVERVLHERKEGFPALSYEVTVDHTSKIIAVTQGFPGTRSDRTIVRFDGYITDIHYGTKYNEVTYPMCDIKGVEHEEKGAWVLCDNGYHKWRCMQCPLKHLAIPREALWSDRAETVRNDAECAFGIVSPAYSCMIC